jgi:hypothetical protein
MSKESDNKAIVGRWFTGFWGETCDLGIVDELAAPDMLLQYSLHAPRRGHDDIKAFMTGFREAFPDLAFSGAADLIAEGDYVVGRWKGGGTHTGPAFSDFLVGVFASGDGPEDAIHWNDGASDRKRQDHGGDRSGRWRDRPATARPHPRDLIESGPLSTSLWQRPAPISVIARTGVRPVPLGSGRHHARNLSGGDHPVEGVLPSRLDESGSRLARGCKTSIA